MDDSLCKVDVRLAVCEVTMRETANQIDKLIKAQELNASNIAHLTESTQGVVDAWVVANGLQKFIKWVSSFAIIGGIIAWLNGFIK